MYLFCLSFILYDWAVTIYTRHLLHGFIKKARRRTSQGAVNDLIKQNICLAMRWHTANTDIISPRQQNTQTLSSSSANTAFIMTDCLSIEYWQILRTKSLKKYETFILSEMKCTVVCERLCKKQTNCMININCKNKHT